jgi:NADH-quinone oxidoreductase subunit C/D
MIETATTLDELEAKFAAGTIVRQTTRDKIPTFWVNRDKAHGVLHCLKQDITRPYKMLYDLSAIDERDRVHREGQPQSDLTVVYHLLSFDRNQYLRIKIPLYIDSLHIATITDIWPSANWYEREMWDMFGIVVDGHPHLTRILMPKTWVGHPLRKEHPARATEMGPFHLSDEKQEAEQEGLRFRPEEWGMKRGSEDSDFIFLNVGPQHPGTHGILRIVLQLDGEVIVDSVPEIGFHHRGAEKMGERRIVSVFGHRAHDSRRPAETASSPAQSKKRDWRIPAMRNSEFPQSVPHLQFRLCHRTTNRQPKLCVARLLLVLVIIKGI